MVKERFIAPLSLQLSADRAALHTTGFSRCDQSARRAHPLCSKPAALWFQLKPPAKQQDGEEHNQHTQENTGCVHRMTLPGEFCIDCPGSPRPVAQGTADIAQSIDFAHERCQRCRRTAYSLKRLRWENFRWTGLGQKT
jgi:hypothetical protein